MPLPRLLSVAALCAAVAQPLAAADLITFWDMPQKGANGFNATPQDDA